MMLIREKVKQAKAILEELGIDCWLTFVRESGINGDPVLPFLVEGDLTWHSALLITATGKTRAIVGRYDVKAVEDLGVYDRVEGYVEGIKGPLQAWLESADPGVIAVNFSKDSEICDGLTHGMYLILHELLAEIGMEGRIVSAEKVVSALRQRKTGAEIARMKEAVRATEAIFDAVEGYIRPGRTEAEIAAFMKAETADRGLKPAWDPQCCPSVFTGPDTAGAHYRPTDRPVEAGHILNMDFGVMVEGYVSDLQRTFYLLRPGETSAPSEVRKGFDTVVGAIGLARKALKPGVQGVEVDGVARRHVTGRGFEAFPHGLGHQVGRFAHDGTALLGPAWEKYGKKPFEPVEENMVFTLEPRVTVEGYGVATVEEMVRVTAEGAEFLSTPQRELRLIGS